MPRPATALALIAPALFTLAALCSPASAQEGPLGVAFAQAPEAGGGVCFSRSADQGLACARAKCVANSGLEPADCLRVAWCFPAGWSGDIFLQHKEGPHWHQVLCGWQSREDLMAAAKVACEGSQSQYLIECAVVQVWDPEGKPQMDQ